VFDQGTLVLEGVTLAELVEFVVEVLVDLAGGTVLDQKTAEDTETSHPEDLTVEHPSISHVSCPQLHGIRNLRRHPSILGTLSLTVATVSADSSSLVEGSSAGTRVHGNGLANNEAIANELADGLTGVGVRDFVDFVGIEPDLALSATDDGSRQALLSTEVDPVEQEVISISFLRFRKVLNVMNRRGSGVRKSVSLIFGELRGRRGSMRVLTSC
jgi:hypothetical protein